MGKLFFEDVEVGTNIPALVKRPTTRQLVKWAGATLDYYEGHYDKDFAQRLGLPGVIVHGCLKAAFLVQLITDWVKEEGGIKKLSCSFRGMDPHSIELTCRGKVTKKYVEGDEHLIECELWIDNANGERTTEGAATIILPSKG